MNNTHKIKVAEVITRMDWGGSPDVLRILCQKLDPNLYDIRLIIGQTKNPTAKTKEFLKQYQEKLTVIPQLQREINPFRDIAALMSLYALFRKGKFDIVHTHTAKAGALGRVAAYLCAVPALIHTPHGHNFYGYFNTFLSRLIIIIEKALAPFTDKIMVLTELEKNDYIRYGVCVEKKLVLIYTGLELEKFSPAIACIAKLRESLGIGSARNTVGFIGRLENIKGPQYFLEAARLVLRERNNTKFILVGEGSLRNCLEKQVEGWGLKDKIIFTGWRDDIPEIMSVLDLLVLPSLNEAVGMVLIEAQSQGIPVVASSVGGIPETVKDQETGILVSPKDINAIARAILTMLDNPQKRQAMSQSAQFWVRNRFKAERMVEQVAATYTQMLKDKHVIS
jgi:glycosyltransferase involved in cell wall biosynthesis